jgi:CelD/BcsL family acetyltransferase involved in cellulose biosynthesis
VSPATATIEPACPEEAKLGERPPERRLVVDRATVASIEPGVWDGVAARTSWATPFSRHGFHRAWWDAYSDNAHEETVVVRDADASPDAAPVAIVPLMHRHRVEPNDVILRTTIRHTDEPDITRLPPHAKVVYFGASYHADYATILAAPEDLPDVAAAVADYLTAGDDEPGFDMPWDAVDLRRLRCGDPAGEAMRVALEERSAVQRWRVTVEREDVCPVATFPDGGMEDYLNSLDKKARHEIRRKLRRAEEQGPIALVESTEPLADLDQFIELHQKRWGEDGLFPDTPGGEQSRGFARRLFELFDPGELQLFFLDVGGQRIAAGIAMADAETCFYYNAGIDPAAKDLSPGVVLVERLAEWAIATGRRRLDFLRGDEGYKYTWGAEDEPIQRLLVRRTS